MPETVTLEELMLRAAHSTGYKDPFVPEWEILDFPDPRTGVKATESEREYYAKHPNYND